jgi:hypothetical protein
VSSAFAVARQLGRVGRLGQAIVGPPNGLWLDPMWDATDPVWPGHVAFVLRDSIGWILFPEIDFNLNL